MKIIFKAHFAGLLVLLLGFPPLAHAEGDWEAGEAVFRKCKACHMVGEEARNKVGPVLNGIVGRPAGSIEDYNYSDAMASSGLVWDEETLKAYLPSPRTFIEGTKMAFIGLKSDEDIANLIAYLKRFDEEGHIVSAASQDEESPDTAE